MFKTNFLKSLQNEPNPYTYYVSLLHVHGNAAPATGELIRF